MEDSDKEAAAFLEMLAGRREGSAAEQMLRAELMQLAEATRSGEAAAARPLSKEELAQREGLRAMLIADGTLPPIDKAPARATARPAEPGWLARLRGIIGPGSSQGSGSRQLSYGALGFAAVAGLAVLIYPALKGEAPPGEVLRGSGDVIATVADPGATCDRLETALLAAGLPRHHVTKSAQASQCVLEVKDDDAALQKSAAAIFAEVGAVVPPSAGMAVKLIKK